MTPNELNAQYPEFWESLDPATKKWLSLKGRGKLSLKDLKKNAEHQLEDRQERLQHAQPSKRHKVQTECDDLGAIVADLNKATKKRPKVKFRSIDEPWEA